jgi:hypothetical protein
MHDITYMSDANRQRLIDLNEELRTCATIEEQQLVREEIIELESKRKSLGSCTLNECTELRTFVYDKFEKLNRAGKLHLAQQMMMMLRQIETRQMLIYREMSVAEQERRLNQTGKNGSESISDIKKARNGKSGGSKTKSSTTTSRWTTGIGHLD